MYGVRFMLFALYYQVKTPMSFSVSKAHNLVSPYLCKLNDQSHPPPPHFICLSRFFYISVHTINAYGLYTLRHYRNVDIY